MFYFDLFESVIWISSECKMVFKNSEFYVFYWWGLNRVKDRIYWWLLVFKYSLG